MARSPFYHQLKRPAPGGADALRDAVARVHAQHRGRYGYRRITAQLQAEGLAVNAKAVRARMRALGLAGHCPKRKWRRPKGEASGIAPNVLARDFAAAAPGRKWATDVTQYTIRGETGYFSPMIDLFNGEIVAYSLARRPGLALVLSMARRAFRAARPPAAPRGGDRPQRPGLPLPAPRLPGPAPAARGGPEHVAAGELLGQRLRREPLRPHEGRAPPGPGVGEPGGVRARPGALRGVLQPRPAPAGGGKPRAAPRAIRVEKQR